MTSELRVGLLSAPHGSAEAHPPYGVHRIPTRLYDYFDDISDRTPDAPALICGDVHLSYRQLESKANQFAHFLRSKYNAAPEKTVGLLLERGLSTYTSLIGVLKSGAGYVPFDPAYPTDRVQFIAEDASLVLIITQESLYQQHTNAGIQWPCPVLVIDRMDPRESQELAQMPAFRPPTLAPESDPLAYIIYTSGTTGKPKGVAVSHWNVVHEIHAVTNLYKMTPQDRCYQGITIAFDFAVEETWIAWAAGAVLIAGIDPKKKVGPGLAKFLNDNRITVFGGVPTLVSTLDDDIPTLRCLIVGGEHLPPEMVERWCKPGRQMWNTYGPTETTITSSMIEVHVGKPVTIGFPLPGYTWYVLDDNLKRLPDGEIGEIVIGGVGVTRGYVNRPELTREKFLDDPFIDPAMVKVARPMMYRSGDRGRINPETQEMEIMGRADDQVKLRGYRFELQEIITLLLEDPAVNNATVATLPFGGPPQDLAAYVTLRQGWDSPDQKEQNPVHTEAELRERLADRLRAKLPTFIVPAYIEILSFLPTLPSGKTDRKSLPQPRSERVLAIKKKEGQRIVLPQNQMEETISKVWAKVFSGAELSVEADFFLDMGGHSLFAAQTISSLRKSDPVFADLSVADLYAYPTIRSLAQYIEDQRQAARATPSQTEDLHAYTEDGHELAPMPERKRYSSCRIWFCGMIQFLLLFVWGMAMMAPIAFILLFWRREDRDIIWACILIAIPIFFPIIAKWVLLGKIKPGRHELWSWYYIRFWLIRKILLLSPVGVLAGTPLIGYYMRTFGAKISSKCHIFSAFFGLPDLIEIEEGACVGYQVVIQPFIIEDGWLDIAPIKICKNATVGTGCFLQAGCVVEEGAVLSDQTLVCRYQRIPANENWGGSPARRMPSRDPAIAWMDSFPEPESCCDNCLTNFLGRSVLNITYLATIIFLTALPVTTAIPSVVILYYGNKFYDYNYVYYFLPIAGVAYFFSTILFVLLGKKIVLWGLEPGVYPINSFFGLRKWVSDKLMEMSLRTNYSLYSTLYTIPFLRLMGAKIGTWSEVSTVQHIEPDLMNLGNGVFIADMASLGAATFHRGRMALAPTVVGDRTFVGNSAVVRCNTTIPEKCLIGVHSVPPVTAIAEGTSYLGSPSMFLPRRQIVEGFPESTTFKPPAHLVVYRLFIEFWRILIPPMLLISGGFLFYQSSIWLLDFGSETLHLRHTHHTLQYWMVLYLSVVAFLEAIVFVLLVALLKWLIIGKYIKQMVPLWDPWIRHTEFVTGLYEALIVPILNTFGGTPFLAIFMRIYGVKIGSRVYLDTADITEFDLVDIEDDATVCGPTSLQTHLFEDRIMKMSYVRIRRGANVSARCVVLYDSEIGEEARLDSLSLVMKNESIPANTSWRGIPSRRVGQQDRARPITQSLTEVLVGDESRRSSVEERTPSKKPAKKGADGYSLLADDA